MTRLVVLRRARFEQNFSGSGSDNDRDRALREGRNTTGERSGDDDSLLAGALLLPPDLLGEMFTRVLTAGAMITTPIGLGVAMVMMVMVAIPRGGGGDESK